MYSGMVAMCSPQMVWLLRPLTSPGGGGKVKPQIWWIQYPLSKLSILTATTIDTLCCRSAPCIHSRKEVYQSLLLLYMLHINFLSEKMLPPFSTLVPTINLRVSKFMRSMPSVISLPQLYPQAKVPRKLACYTWCWVLGRVESSLFSFCNIFCEMVVWWTVILLGPELSKLAIFWALWASTISTGQ